jgi:hypothetical protein
MKLIETLADDLDAEVTLTKRDLATLIQMVAKECLKKLGEATQADAENNEDAMDVDKESENGDAEHPIECGMDVDEESKSGDAEQPIEEHATNGQSFHSNRSVTVCNQEINVPRSHDLISRSYKSRLKTAARLSAQLKKKCKAKKNQRRSSQLGRRCCNSASYQAPRLWTHMAEQIFLMVIAGHLEDAGIPFEAEATANSCPSAKTSNSCLSLMEAWIAHCG